MLVDWPKWVYITSTEAILQFETVEDIDNCVPILAILLQNIFPLFLTQISQHWVILIG